MSVGSPLVFGLTGGIGTGKSTVARRLREHHHIPVIDADEAARAVVAPGSDGLAAVVDAFGPEVLTPDGALDRPAMRRRVMGDAEARKRLEAITHPRIAAWVMARVGEALQSGHDLVGVEAALMVETGSHRNYGALLVVSCDPATQLARVQARDGVTEAEARRVLEAQLPLAQKEAVADHVIRNDGSLAALHAAVDAWVDATRAHQGA